MKHKALNEDGSSSAERGAPEAAPRGVLSSLGWNAAFDGVIVTDRDGTVLEAGGAAAALFGRELAECEGVPLAELLLAPEARVEREGERGGLAAVDRFPYEGRRLESTARHASGRTFPVSVNVEKLAGQGRAAFVCVVRDVSDLEEARKRRQNAERELGERLAELRTLALKLPLDIENERRRIARGLHDQVGNALAMAKMGLGQLRRASSDEQTLTALDEIERQTAEAMQEIRSLTFELSSPVLYELGLEAALKSLGKRLGERHGIRFRFSSDDQPKPLSEDHQVILYRTIEELLVNVVKHAWASEARIAVERSGDEIRIAVEDDGVGLESLEGKQPGPDGGFGLYGARQRLAHIDGRLEIESTFPSGTRARVSAPLDIEAD
jgi:PAS domain S-box-containing protein